MEFNLVSIKQQVIEQFSMLAFNVGHSVLVDNEDFLLFLNGLLKQVNYALIGDEEDIEEEVEE